MAGWYLRRGVPYATYVIYRMVQMLYYTWYLFFSTNCRVRVKPFALLTWSRSKVLQVSIKFVKKGAPDGTGP